MSRHLGGLPRGVEHGEKLLARRAVVPVAVALDDGQELVDRRLELAATTPYRKVRPDFERWASDLEATEETVALERTSFLATLRRYLDHRGLSVEWDAARQAPAGALINSLAMGLPLDPAEKQALLEAPTIGERGKVLRALLEIDSAAGDDEPPPLQ